VGRAGCLIVCSQFILLYEVDEMCGIFIMA
jgi:hypothetical protein